MLKKLTLKTKHILNLDSGVNYGLQRTLHGINPYVNSVKSAKRIMM